MNDHSERENSRPGAAVSSEIFVATCRPARHRSAASQRRASIMETCERRVRSSVRVGAARVASEKRSPRCSTTFRLLRVVSFGGGLATHQRGDRLLSLLGHPGVQVAREPVSVVGGVADGLEHLRPGDARVRAGRSAIRLTRDRSHPDSGSRNIRVRPSALVGGSVEAVADGSARQNRHGSGARQGRRGAEVGPGQPPKRPAPAETEHSAPATHRRRSGVSGRVEKPTVLDSFLHRCGRPTDRPLPRLREPVS